MITFIAAATSVHKGSNLAVMTVCYACSLRKKFTSTKTQKGLRFLKTDIIIELKEPSRRVIFFYLTDGKQFKKYRMFNELYSQVMMVHRFLFM